jgi:hypothetical protein
MCLALASPVLAETVATPLPSASATPQPDVQLQRMHLHADRIDYDGDRYLLVARGHVQLSIAGGFQASARYFTMDVKADRYLLAGHVRISGPNVTLEGAALANFLEFGRVYFLPSAATPDRVTFLGENFSDPVSGREMPGDAFTLPENVTHHPLLEGKDVVVTPHVSLRFALAQLNTGLATVPVPDYVLNLSKNPNFSQNSLAGAGFDAAYPFAGSKNSSTAFHIRAGGGNGIFGAIEQRFVWDKSYIVGSISPLNHPQKQYNILGSTSLTPTLQLQGFAQTQAYQHDFSQPLAASQYINLRLTQALKHSYLQYTIDQYYQSLLGDPNHTGPCPILTGQCYGDASHEFVPNHPVDMQWSWIGFEQKLPNRIPLKYRLRSGYNYDHDSAGILPFSALLPGTISYTAIDPQYQTLIGVGVQNVTYSYLGATLFTPSYRLSRDRNGNDVYLNASVDMQRKWYSLPHQVNTMNSTISLSKSYGTKVSTFASYNVLHTGDQYGDQERDVYPLPSADSPVFGKLDFSTFDGFSTIRTMSQGIVFTPNPQFNASLTFAETNDYPRTVPNVFGPAPFSITGEVRARVRPHLMIDLTRTYNYNYGTQRFNPGYGLLIGG